MPQSELVLDSIESSNMPHREKSMVRRMFEKMGGLTQSGSRARSTVHHGLHTVRHAGESAMTGAVLGAISAESSTGLDIKKVPVDLAAAGLSLAASAIMADEMSQDARNVGGTALGIYTYRQTERLLKEKRASSGGAKAHGEADVGEDPIVAAAKNL